ncbi:MAG: hypothetical protein PHV34_18475 [Verrucomicrobiae bacterium]|nr:hypothetical protein [Verrucomicrobiae bacterium]
MKIPFQTARWTIVFAGILALAAREAAACGLAFRTPVNFYDGCSETGLVSLWWKLVDVDCDGQKIPLILHFTSRERNSRLVGAGFELFPFDSLFLQEDQQRWVLTQPDGWFNHFGKSKPADTVLKGATGWAAEIRDNSATVWTECSWKLEYAKAQLMAMSNRTRRIEFVRTGPDGAVSAIRCGGSVVLRVERDPVTGEPSALVYGEKRLTMAWNNRPVIISQTVNGRSVSVVKGLERTLKRLVWPDGKSRQFEFGVTGETQPFLKITEADGGWRCLTWDAATRLILTDAAEANTWRYSIKPGPNPSAAAIERKNSKGESEHLYRANGREEILSANGVKKVSSTFVSGPLAGKTRSVMISKGECLLSKRTFSYDEQAKLMRQTDSDGDTTVMTQFKYDKEGRVTEILQDGKPLARYAYDEKGRVAEADVLGVEKNSFRYLNDGGYEKVTWESNGDKSVEIFDKQDSIVKARYSGGKGLAATGKLLPPTVRGTTEARDLEIRKLSDQIERAKTSIERGDLLLRIGGIYANGADWPGDLRAALTTYDRILDDPAMDSLTKARAHAWAAGAYIELGPAEKENVRRHTEAILTLDGDGLPPGRQPDFQAEKTCAFRLLLSLDATRNPVVDEKNGRMLLAKYGNTDDFRKQLDDMLVYEKREWTKRYLKNHP